MQASDNLTEIKRTRLRDAIERGYEDAAAGKVIRLENNDEIDSIFADLWGTLDVHRDRPRGSEIDTPLIRDDVGFGANDWVHDGPARYP